MGPLLSPEGFSASAKSGCTVRRHQHRSRRNLKVYSIQLLHFVAKVNSQIHKIPQLDCNVNVQWGKQGGTETMSVAAITVAALLVASPNITDADRVAANGGFLLGNAHRCGVDDNRVTRAGQLIRTLISAAAPDDKAEENATERFSAFFLVSAVADPKSDKLVASCK